MYTSPGVQPVPVRKKSSKTWIVVLVIVLGLCVVCSVLAAGGAGWYYLQQNTTENVLPFDIGQLPGAQTPEAAIPPVNTPASASQKDATPATQNPETSPQDNSAVFESYSPLSHTYNDLKGFLTSKGGFSFDAPITTDQGTAIKGTSKTVCVQAQCSSGILLGSEKNLYSIILNIPFDSQSSEQNSKGFRLVTDLVVYFAGTKSDLGATIVKDIQNAISTQTTLYEQKEANGMLFVEFYGPKDHVGGVTISKKK